MTLAHSPKFCLGTFSVAGCKPFAGLVIEDRVVAVQALNETGGIFGRKLFGAETVLGLLENWEDNLFLLREAVQMMAASGLGEQACALQALSVPVSSLHVHAPVERPGQILMARANYRKHIIEMSVKMGRGQGDTEAERRTDIERMIDRKAKEGDPFLWVKLLTSVAGPYDEIPIPPTTQKADWELELAIIIGKPAYRISKDEALLHVAGYCMANDLSARDLIARDEFGPSLDWVAGKCSPSFMPMGPYLVPGEFVKNPDDLRVELKHNGKIMQDERTSDMIHDVRTLVSYASRHVQLMPGDIISSGSPAGNGMEFGIFLADGDVVEGTIDGLGMQRNRFRA